ncbi:MAG: hypothetical protein WAM60_17780, partial [Candidatus Promineifilaceae bacterium]
LSGTTFGSTTNFAIVRYESNGTLDDTFGTNGIVTTNLSSSDIAREIAVQPDGKIVVGGSSEVNGDQDFIVVRYNSNGSLDTSFDGDGIVITPISSSTDEIWGIALQSDGKIVAVGNSDGQFTIVRYNSNGSLDSSFDGDGIATPIAGSGQAVRIQTDGKIVVAGRNSSDFTVVRLNPNGTPDNSFDTDGVVTTPMGNGPFISAWDVSLQSDGKLVVVGSSYNGSDHDMAVLRYNSNGSLDTSFSTDGKVVYDSGNGPDEGMAVAIQSNNKIVIGGYSNTGGEAFTLLRLNPDGSFDNGFGGNGIVITNEGQRGLGLTIQADNKIIMTGYYSGDYVTARYEGDEILIFDHHVYLPIVQRP